MVEHDMGVVFGLADRIAVLVYGEVIAFDTPEACAPMPPCRKPISGRWRTHDARSLATCTPTTARATSCTASTSVGEGEIVSLLGRNGSAARPPSRRSWAWCRRRGSVQGRRRSLGLQALRDRPPRHRLRAGDRDIFPKLTVHQNLRARAEARQEVGRWSFDDMYRMFPRLKERQHTEAGVLSGGEQQMLTLCRTLMGDPDLIIIDEPTEGLAPKIVELVALYLKIAEAPRLGRCCWSSRSSPSR
jgi:ABC-type branched-subunit amino acid transport system ATPase component